MTNGIKLSGLFCFAVLIAALYANYNRECPCEADVVRIRVNDYAPRMRLQLEQGVTYVIVQDRSVTYPEWESVE